MNGGNVRCWHLTDNQTVPAFVRYWSNSGHRSRIAKCPLMTRSGHWSC